MGFMKGFSMTSHKVHLKGLLKQALEDMGAFSKLLTEVDNLGVRILEHEQLLQPPKLAFRVGITGGMGVGKSVLVNCLIESAKKEKLKVGVLAVDPTSPFCGGAILGDRIRLSSSLSLNDKVFFRSIGSRGSLGGLCAQAYLILRAFDWAGFDIVFVETVGVGQTEWEVMNVADIVTLVLVPESGDKIQLIKSGLMEIANIFIVNKSDRPGAGLLKTEILKNAQNNDSQKVFSTIGIKNQGIKPIFDYFLETKKQGQFQKQRWSKERLQAEAKALLRLKWEKEFSKSLLSIATCEDLKTVLLDPPDMT